MSNENIRHDDPFGPTSEEVERWAQRERERRERWLQGPTAAEQRAWALRERQRRINTASRSMAGDSEVDRDSPLDDPSAGRMMRDAELVTAGAASWILGGPFWLMSRLMRSGRAFERSSARARRVPFPEDDEL